MLRRRDIVIFFGALAAAWPAQLRAQQPNRLRRIGALMGFSRADDGRPFTSTLEKSLQGLGWSLGVNVEIHYRWAGSDPARIQEYARELVAFGPDVLLAGGTGNLVALSQRTRSIPIVFIQVTNPDGGGFVANLSRLGGNITGISNPDVSILGDRIKVLKEIAPKISRLLVLFEPNYPTVPSSLRIVDTTTAALGIKVSHAPVHNIEEVEQAIRDFSGEPAGGVAVIQSALFTTRRDRITALAVEHGLPGIFHLRAFVVSGGLASYGIDQMAMYAQVPTYLDRILRGESPADIPVQEPNKSEFIINLKVAKQLGLEIPKSTIARADEVIQ
jgi:putative tryptophan/tyrosine transport system substrate-binding protein